jgi:hypothetical protein
MPPGGTSSVDPRSSPANAAVLTGLRIVLPALLLLLLLLLFVPAAGVSSRQPPGPAAAPEAAVCVQQ